jgi:hypothetical protein
MSDRPPLMASEVLEDVETRLAAAHEVWRGYWVAAGNPPPADYPYPRAALDAACLAGDLERAAHVLREALTAHEEEP